jgi:hypothetical protein
MVLLVLASGDSSSLLQVRGSVRSISNGWHEFALGVWLIGKDGDSNILTSVRDTLGGFGAHVMVIRLQGAWAAKGMDGAVKWLQSARDSF